jgi:Secretion system C-terminal sorting domain
MKAKLYTIIISLFLVQNIYAAPTIVNGNSFIINMGVVPQTIANGLKPYGLVYQMMVTHKVPIYWVINQSKVKDGIDFTYNGVDYRGGTFIIPGQFRTAAVNTAISNFIAAGGIGATTNPVSFTLDVTQILDRAPQWTLDKDNGNIAAAFFVNAGIPASAHGGSSSALWKTPAQLGPCDEIFVMPHADPTWATHNNLYYWNKNYKGNIWAGCHAISVLESITSPDLSVKMNFLTADGFINYKDHADGTPVYSYSYPTDPVMQFMGTMDAACQNGSEQIFMPLSGSSWLPATKLCVYDPTQSDVPAISAGPAAVTAYGFGFGDNTRGMVMYQGAHDISGGGAIAARVAAQRSFFNYSFTVANTLKKPFDITINGVEETIAPYWAYPLSFSVPAYVDLSKYTIQWSSSGGPGSFNVTNAQSVTFRGTGTVGQTYIISVTLTDACGSTLQTANGTYYDYGLLSTNYIDLHANLKQNNLAGLSWKNEYTTNQPNQFIIEKSINGAGFSQIGIVAAIDKAPGRISLPEYSFNDNSFSQVAFYRVQSISKTGIAKYSNTVKVVAKNNKDVFTLLQNPVQSGADILLKSAATGNYDIRIADMNGKPVMQKNILVKAGDNYITLPLSPALSSGMYIVMISNGKEIFTERLIKNR